MRATAFLYQKDELLRGLGIGLLGGLAGFAHVLARVAHGGERRQVLAADDGQIVEILNHVRP